MKVISLMKNLDNDILIFGIGNSGRQDDGLGWAFLEFLETQNLPFTIEYRYQLQIEDAELLTRFNTVIFVDATKEKTENGFIFSKCQASEQYSFSTHALKPETILYLAQSIYKHNPRAFILAIEGYKWELEIGLTPRAKANLDCVTKVFIEELINDYIYINN